MNFDINELLRRYFERPVDTSRLKHLESDVWSRIVARKQEQPVGWFEQLLSVIFQPQYRLAPVMAAAVLGIVVGSGTMQPPAPDAAEMLNFKVFKPKMIALASITSNYEHL